MFAQSRLDAEKALFVDSLRYVSIRLPYTRFTSTLYHKHTSKKLHIFSCFQLLSTVFSLDSRTPSGNLLEASQTVQLLGRMQVLAYFRFFPLVFHPSNFSSIQFDSFRISLRTILSHAFYSKNFLAKSISPLTDQSVAGQWLSRFRSIAILSPFHSAFRSD